MPAPSAAPACVRAVDPSRARPVQALWPRPGQQPRRTSDPAHSPAALCWWPVSPAWAGVPTALHTSAPWWPDIPARHPAWPRCDAARATSCTPPAPPGVQPPARPSPAPATARSPPAQQTKETVPKTAWPSATGATAPSRLAFGTSGTQPAAILRPPSPRPRSTILPQQTPRTAAGAPAAPREGAPATSACPAKPDPNAVDPPPQQSS